jgi:hypothetical protein
VPGRWTSWAPATLLVLAGCGHAAIRVYSGDVPEERLGALRTVWGVAIESVDGNKEFSCEGYACTFLSRAGRHTFLVRYAADGVRSKESRPVELTLQAGHEYYAIAMTNAHLDDWCLDVTEAKTHAALYSDRAQHCTELVPRAPGE